MSREQKIKEGQILLNDLDKYSPLEKQMADETVEKIKQLTKSMLTESHIDEMTVKWLSQTSNPLRIAEFYTLTNIHRPTLVGIISKSKIKPLVWKRYIDDVFCVWHTNEDNIKEFVTRANHYHDTLKFTAEISDSEIAFLDTKVYKGERFSRDSTLDVQMHYKQTETFQYTKFLFVSSTRRKERIHKRRGAASPKNKFVTLDV